ncbi:diguanylate cyclase domain-containing protein [Thiorhodovibrio frisius]|uniref:Diguanylate cyclase (GGDEF) domain-containing protein n=1 Tax=Thiorhodovibrio frisius TaxID=631362 RepID=H8Z6H5_9GAMM|nr:diguanylate cyclase [Thiorhodovibrio frisius]EIC19673.1 diguanylate cyclase (GGDEF) domain-containing protein [Thiorhodovibrio frisius]WPL20359.1 putative diguanylate cyclase YcdT [Thiorhodovibrio frisius]
MLNLRRLSITWVLVALILITILVYELVSATVGKRTEQQAAERIAKKQVEALSLVVAQHIEARIQLDQETKGLGTYITELEQLRDGLEIRVYRSASIIELFGNGHEHYHPGEGSEDVQRVFSTGEAEFSQTEQLLRMARPLKATAACLRCHHNAQVGEVLGVVTVASVAQTMREAIKALQHNIHLTHDLISLFSLLVGFVLVERLLVRPIRRLNLKLSESREVSDYRYHLHPDVPLCREMHELNSGFAGLMARLRERYLHMHEMAHRDALTGLLNRRGFVPEFQAELRKAERYGQRIALIAIDLNGFKAINDACGHAAGDQCLASVAEAINEVLREEVLFARVGGDEFQLLVPNLAAHDRAEAIVHRIEQAVAGITVDCGSSADKRSVTTSIGVAIYPTDAVEMAALEQIADQRMYDAKALKRPGA